MHPFSALKIQRTARSRKEDKWMRLISLGLKSKMKTYSHRYSGGIMKSLLKKKLRSYASQKSHQMRKSKIWLNQ